MSSSTPAGTTFAYALPEDLRHAELAGRVLSGARLAGRDLEGANLAGCKLVRADLGGARLALADLEGADLRGANLVGADLRQADLSGADLSGAALAGAQTEGCAGFTPAPGPDTGPDAATWFRAVELLTALLAEPTPDDEHVLDVVAAAAEPAPGWGYPWEWVGLAMEAAGRPALAHRLLQEAATRAPSVESVRGLGRLLLGAGQLDAATELLLEQRRSFPDDPSIQADLGYLLGRGGYFEEAAYYLGRALDGGVRDANTWNAMGVVAYHLRQWGRAEQAWREAARLRPDDPGIALNVSLLCEQRGDQGGALVCLQRYAETGPAAAPVARRLADLFGARGELRAALEQVELAVPLLVEPSERDAALLQGAALLLRRGEPQRAEEWLARLGDEVAASDEAVLLRARCAWARGKDAVPPSEAAALAEMDADWDAQRASSAVAESADPWQPEAAADGEVQLPLAAEELAAVRAQLPPSAPFIEHTLFCPPWSSAYVLESEQGPLLVHRLGPTMPPAPAPGAPAPEQGPVVALRAAQAALPGARAQLPELVARLDRSGQAFLVHRLPAGVQLGPWPGDEAEQACLALATRPPVCATGALLGPLFAGATLGQHLLDIGASVEALPERVRERLDGLDGTLHALYGLPPAWPAAPDPVVVLDGFHPGCMLRGSAGSTETLVLALPAPLAFAGPAAWEQAQALAWTCVDRARLVLRGEVALDPQAPAGLGMLLADREGAERRQLAGLVYAALVRHTLGLAALWPAVAPRLAARLTALLDELAHGRIARQLHVL